MTSEQRQKRLQNITTTKGFYDLYEEVFGEEVPPVYILDGNKKTEMIVNAIFDNKKIEFNVPKDIDIWKNSINLI